MDGAKGTPTTTTTKLSNSQTIEPPQVILSQQNTPSQQRREAPTVAELIETIDWSTTPLGPKVCNSHCVVCNVMNSLLV